MGPNRLDTRADISAEVGSDQKPESAYVNIVSTVMTCSLTIYGIGFTNLLVMAMS